MPILLLQNSLTRTNGWVNKFNQVNQPIRHVFTAHWTWQTCQVSFLEHSRKRTIIAKKGDDRSSLIRDGCTWIYVSSSLFPPLFSRLSSIFLAFIDLNRGRSSQWTFSGPNGFSRLAQLIRRNRSDFHTIHPNRFFKPYLLGIYSFHRFQSNFYIRSQILRLVKVLPGFSP